jgi:hypothetical protein
LSSASYALAAASAAVAILRHRPKTVEDVDDVFLRANVGDGK